MCDDRQYGHVFFDVPASPHRKRSETIARAFCEAYARRFGISAEFVVSEKNRIDAIIRVGTKEVALELVGYRQRDPFLKVEHADSELKKAISDELGKPGIPPLNVRLEWKENSRRTGESCPSARQAQVPPVGTEECRQFLSELVALARRVSNDNSLSGKRIRFGSARAAAQLPATVCTVLDKSHFPYLARYCSFVRLTIQECSASPTIGSSADVRHIGLDGTQLREKVDNKIQKAGKYRERAQGRPIWLVVHCDGWPLSAQLWESDQDRALQIVGECCVQSSGAFERVWWLQDAKLGDSARIYEVELTRQDD